MKGNYKNRAPTMFTKGLKLYKLTPGGGWHGGKELVGKEFDAVLVDGRYYDEDGGMFIMGDDYWVLVEEHDHG
ncbi:MAG: hypothetical protein V3T88_00150 [Nitrosomonadaceae bacterium]